MLFIDEKSYKVAVYSTTILANTKYIYDFWIYNLTFVFGYDSYFILVTCPVLKFRYYALNQMQNKEACERKASL